MRLARQHLVSPQLTDPASVVTHLGAVQAQDYDGARWALGQRLRNALAEVVDGALDEGAILRTHVMRPTWHFVAPADIRWLLALTGPRVKATMASYDRALGVDDTAVARANDAIERVLEGGKHLTRAELGEALRQAGIAVPDGVTLGNMLMHAELDAVVCSGPRRGKQFTYARLEERVPPVRPLERDQALAELTARYFSSHGPATVRDFNWWSGLTMADVKRGLELCGSRLACETVGGLTYWFAPGPPPPPMSDTVYLLPNYDEYTIAYRERDLYYDPARGWTPDRRDEAPFYHAIIVAGRVAGLWRRTARKNVVMVKARWLDPVSDVERQGLAAAVERYSAFVGLPVELAGS